VQIQFVTITGDFAKGFVIVGCIAFLVLMIEFLIIGQTALAMLMLVGFMIPLSVFIYGYVKDRRDIKRTKQ
jgi:hypothetical protein